MSISPDTNQRRALHTLTKQYAHLQHLKSTLADCDNAWDLKRAGDYLGYAQGSIAAILGRHGIEVRP